MTRTSIIEQARISAEAALQNNIKKDLEQLHSTIGTVFTREDASAATYYTWRNPLMIFAELDGVIFSLSDGQELRVLFSGESIPTAKWATILTSGELHFWADSAVVAAQGMSRAHWKPQVTPA